MSLYFLQFNISSPADNFYYRFVKMMKSLPTGIYLATLNYDLLLEQALLIAGLYTTWEQTEGIFKLHGSPNYLVDEGGVGYFVGGSFANNRYSNITADVTVRDPGRAHAYCSEALRLQNPYAPAIALYAEGKRVYNSPQFITKIQTRFKKYVAGASTILLVGVRLNEPDSHIWEPIVASNARIGVIDPLFDPYQDWGRRHSKDVTHICSTAAEVFDAPGVTTSSKLLKFVEGST